MKDDFLANLLDSTRAEDSAKSGFKPVARYFEALDCVIYLNEDVSYRADRVDTYLTLLWHPYADRVVGVRFKGFKFIFRQLQSIMGGLKEAPFLPLIKVLELVLTAGYADVGLAKQERNRLQEKYDSARAVIGEAHLGPEELMKINKFA